MKVQYPDNAMTSQSTSCSYGVLSADDKRFLDVFINVNMCSYGTQVWEYAPQQDHCWKGTNINNVMNE